jgi:hypothetical protein
MSASIRLVTIRPSMRRASLHVHIHIHPLVNTFFFEFGSWRVYNGNMVYIYICYVVARRFYLMSVLYMPCNVTDFFDVCGVASVVLKVEVRHPSFDP